MAKEDEIKFEIDGNVETIESNLKTQNEKTWWETFWVLEWIDSLTENEKELLSFLYAKKEELINLSKNRVTPLFDDPNFRDIIEWNIKENDRIYNEVKDKLSNYISKLDDYVKEHIIELLEQYKFTDFMPFIMNVDILWEKLSEKYCKHILKGLDIEKVRIGNAEGKAVIPIVLEKHYWKIQYSVQWLLPDYWEVINRESNLGEKINKKDVYEVDPSYFEKNLEWYPTAQRVLNTLKQLWLKTYINTKTDVSYSNSENWYYICLWLWPVTQQSKETIGVDQSFPDAELYKNKITHEMWHSIVAWNKDHNKNTIDHISSMLITLRNNWISTTKLWSIDRYNNLWKKITEDDVEFIRMYTLNPNNLKKYLWELFEQIWEEKQAELWVSAELLYNDVENLINTFLNQSLT